MDKHIYIFMCVVFRILPAISTETEGEINVARRDNGGTCTSILTSWESNCNRLIDGKEYGGTVDKWATTEDLTDKWITLQFSDTFYLTKIVFIHTYYSDERNIKTVLLSFSDGSFTMIDLTNKVDGLLQNDTSEIDVVSNSVKITILTVYNVDQNFKAMYEIKVFGVEVTASTESITTTSRTTPSTTTSTTTIAVTSTTISSSTSTTKTSITESTTPPTSTQPSSPPTVQTKPTTQTTSLPRNGSAFTNDNNRDKNASNSNIKPISIGVIVFLIALIVILAATFTFVFIKQRRKISSLNDQLNGKAVYENDPTRNVQPSTYEDVSTVLTYEATGGPTEYARMEHIHPSQRPLPGIYADLK